MNAHEVFIHIHQGCFAGTGAIVRLPQCQWSKPDGYGKISQCITTTKHSKAKTVCIFLGIYCMYFTDQLMVWSTDCFGEQWIKYQRIVWGIQFKCNYILAINADSHYNDVIMGTIAFQITSLTIVYSIVYSDADQRKHQSSASLAFVREIHREPLNSPHKWPVMRKCLHLMTSSCADGLETAAKGRSLCSGGIHVCSEHQYEMWSMHSIVGWGCVREFLLPYVDAKCGCRA